MVFNVISDGDPGLAAPVMQNFRHVNYGNTLLPVNSFGNGINDAIDLGSSTYKFKNGYFTSILSVDGLIYNANGTELIPAYNFELDKNCGMYRAADDEIGLVTGGIEKIRIDNLGRVGINDKDPGFTLTISDGGGETSEDALLSLKTKDAYNSVNNQQWMNFRGEYNSSNNLATFAAIKAEKDNVADGDKKGKISLYVNDGTDLTAANKALTIWPTGNISIGLNTEAGRLSVHTALTNQLAFKVGSPPSSGNLSLYFVPRASGMEIQSALTDDEETEYDIYFNPDGGNVGIGSLDPNFALDVNGDIRIEETHKLSLGGTSAADYLCQIYDDTDNIIFRALNGHDFRFWNSLVNTTITNPEEYLQLRYENTTGGAQFQSFNIGNDVAFHVAAQASTVDNTETTTSDGTINLDAFKAGGSYGTNDNIMVVKADGATRFIFKSDGDLYTDTGVISSYDSENDIILTEQIRNMFDGKKVLDSYKEKLEELGIIKNGFMSHNRMHSLNLGAIGQLFNIVKYLAQKLNISQETLLEMAMVY